MKILITNDDGIDAPGLAALVKTAEKFGEPIVAAPDIAWSGCGHQAICDKPIRVTREADDRFRIAGTPADCVRLGVSLLAAEVELVLSGINLGANVGVDIFMSGTVAAAREAMFLGKPAIAISQYVKSMNSCDWEASVANTIRVLESTIAKALDAAGEALWNVNLPDTDIEPEIVECPADYSSLALQYARENDDYMFESNYHERPRIPGGDIDVCFSGNIAVSKLGRNH